MATRNTKRRFSRRQALEAKLRVAQSAYRVGQYAAEKAHADGLDDLMHAAVGVMVVAKYDIEGATDELCRLPRVTR